MGAASTQCNVRYCRREAQHKTRIGKGFPVQYCDDHAKGFMRCESGNVDRNGSCAWCDADQGVTCRRQTNVAN